MNLAAVPALVEVFHRIGHYQREIPVADREALIAGAELASARLTKHGFAHKQDLDVLASCLLGTLGREAYLILSFGERFSYLGFDLVLGEAGTVDVGPQQLVGGPVSRGARFVLTAHCHPDLSAEFSDDDLKAHELHRHLFNLLRIGLLDFGLVAGNKVCWMREQNSAPDPSQAPEIRPAPSPQIHEAAVKLFEAAQLSAAEETIYQRACQALESTSMLPSPMPLPWTSRQFLQWLNEHPDFSIALCAMTRRHQVLQQRIVQPAGEGLEWALQDMARGAIASFGEVFLFAIRGESLTVTESITLAAKAIDVTLLMFDLRVADVLLVAGDEALSLRNSGILGSAPMPQVR